jgi:hypothetical protein
MEIVEISLGTLALASPLLVALGLVVWIFRSASRGRVAYVPLGLSAAGTVSGTVMLATAREGLAGLGDVLIGVYLAGTFGLALLVGIVTLVVRWGHIGTATGAGRGTDHLR